MLDHRQAGGVSSAPCPLSALSEVPTANAMTHGGSLTRQAVGPRAALSAQLTRTEAREDEVCRFLRIGRWHGMVTSSCSAARAAYPLRTSSLFSESFSCGFMNRKITSAGWPAHTEAISPKNTDSSSPDPESPAPYQP
jgi:hypothetical protein